MSFWSSKGEILSLFVTFLTLYDSVSIIFCNFGAYFLKENTMAIRQVCTSCIYVGVSARIAENGITNH